MGGAVFRTIVPARLIGLAADMQSELPGIVARPAAHPRFDIGRRMMEYRFFEYDGFRLGLLLGNFRAAL